MIFVALLALSLYAPTIYPTSDLAHAVFRVAVCLAIAQGVAIPRSRLAQWGIALWATGVVWSVVAAPDPWRAVWSTHNRNEGAWQAAHYLGLTLAAAAVDRAKLARWVGVGALVAVVWTVYPQVAWVGGRFAGPAGNPLYLAPLLLMGVWGAWRTGSGRAPLVWTAAEPWAVWKGAPGSPLAGWAWKAVAAILALGAVATGSAGVGVAVLAAAGVLAARRAPRLLLAGALGVAIGLWAVPLPSSALIRLELWRVAAQGIVAQPWGWGAEAFPRVWDAYWSGSTATGEVWHDRAHSLLLDRAIEWGVAGMVGWGLVVMAAWRRAEPLERAALAAYAAYHLTMFEMVWGAAPFAILLGYCLRGWLRVEGVTDGVPWIYIDGGCRRIGTRTFGQIAAGLAILVGGAALLQTRAAATADTFPRMQAAIDSLSWVGGDLIEIYLRAPQTAGSLVWAADRVETHSPHATQQAYAMAVWDRAWCVDLRVLAPRRPDVEILCGQLDSRAPGAYIPGGGGR